MYGLGLFGRIRNRKSAGIRFVNSTSFLTFFPTHSRKSLQFLNVMSSFKSFRVILGEKAIFFAMPAIKYKARIEQTLFQTRASEFYAWKTRTKCIKRQCVKESG